MVIHTPHIILRLFADILQEFLINRVKSIAKLKLTPKQDPALISKVIQEVRTVRSRSLRERITQVSKRCPTSSPAKQAATHPNPQHVLIPINHTIQKPRHFLDRNSRPKSVRRDEV